MMCYSAGIVAATMVNLLTDRKKRHRKTIKPEDFIPRPVEVKEMDPETMSDIWKGLTRALGGEVVKSGWRDQ